MSGPGRNALGSKMIEFLITELDHAKGEPVLLTGAGGCFSPGLDLKEVLTFDLAAMRSFLARLDVMVERLFDHPAPTVALIDGHAIAGGCVLALCCDFRVAHAGTGRIGLNEANLGVRFPPRTLRLVESRISPHALHEIVLGAELFQQQDALRVGLIDELAADGHSVARARLATLAEHPREAYAATKRALHKDTAAARPGDQALLDAIVPSWTSETVRARIRKILGRSATRSP